MSDLRETVDADPPSETCATCGERCLVCRTIAPYPHGCEMPEAYALVKRDDDE